MTDTEPARLEGDHGVRTDRRRRALAWLWTAGALLASVALALLATLPPVPPGAAAAWVEDGTFPLTWAGELLFFATLAWGTGAAGALATRGAGTSVRGTIALVALGVALVAFVVVLLALGRLVYPVVAGDLAADTVVLLASVVVGAVHLALLGLAVAAFALPVPARSTRARRTIAAVTITLGAVFVVGSYPWLLPTWLNLVTAGAVGFWGVLVGVAMARDPGRAVT
ncbi:hypothetical protein [Cellulomonas fengjieae]|uniref:DUF998 domain-containing protein n=1 Tax=Cellulomonas fengjieae TaxID=2819978 RepID=A0ABS3SL04_9CELL|nr:hypothetical protein [Cellulomonas fengjieae]MBO3086431.1 hypothetical protein [Cellulomonas fengjieae]QVI66703.1 hypothetical protein KG102_03640 [Cellulomonas fengjieae]